jgi:paraquat-inducible protein A
MSGALHLKLNTGFKKTHTVRTMSEMEMPIVIFKQESRFLKIMFKVNIALFVLGLFLPMMTLSKFFMLKNTISLASSVFQLALSGSWLLFIIIFGFSVVMPALKLRVIYVLIEADGEINRQTKRWLHIMHEYGRWGMLDVFVVAVLLVTVKLGVFASVQVHSGLYFFGAAVLLMMLLTHRLSRIYARAAP